MENPTQKWPTKDETISTVAGIIHKECFGGPDDCPASRTYDASRAAAIAVINHLADVYDEAMKNEPPDGQ